MQDPLCVFPASRRLKSVGQLLITHTGLAADAQLQSKPIYCHCRAGKSRSVTIVLAYLVHRCAQLFIDKLHIL